jgi:hypothetical protein
MTTSPKSVFAACVLILSAFAPSIGAPRPQESQVRPQPSASLAEQQKRIESILDLEAGMPRDYVIARLVARDDCDRCEPYKLEKEFGSPDELEAWNVFLFDHDHYAGEIIFKSGKLWSASHRLHTSIEPHTDFGGDVDLGFKLFEAISAGQNEKGAIEPAGDQDWARHSISVVETNRQVIGKFESRKIRLAVGPKLFVISILSKEEGRDKAPGHLTMSMIVTLDEIIVRPSEDPPRK